MPKTCLDRHKASYFVEYCRVAEGFLFLSLAAHVCFIVMPVTRTLSGGSARALSILTLSPRRPELVGLPSRPRALQNMQQQAPAESSTSPDPGSSRQQRKGLVLAAAVAAVWTLLLAAPHVSGPIFLVRPPITRCA